MTDEARAYCGARASSFAVAFAPVLTVVPAHAIRLVLHDRGRPPRLASSDRSKQRIAAYSTAN
jgi:hypothetical protein